VPTVTDRSSSKVSSVLGPVCGPQPALPFSTRVTPRTRQTARLDGDESDVPTCASTTTVVPADKPSTGASSGNVVAATDGLEGEPVVVFRLRANDTAVVVAWPLLSIVTC